MSRDTLSAGALGVRLRAARIARGLSEAAIATELGVEPKVITLWEAGDAIPPFHLLTTVADLLGCSLEELIA
jgi:transcriptional regulator with XRE-family HTH domain